MMKLTPFNISDYLEFLFSWAALSSSLAAANATFFSVTNFYYSSVTLISCKLFLIAAFFESIFASREAINLVNLSTSASYSDN